MIVCFVESKSVGYQLIVLNLLKINIFDEIIVGYPKFKFYVI